MKQSSVVKLFFTVYDLKTHHAIFRSYCLQGTGVSMEQNKQSQYGNIGMIIDLIEYTDNKA